MSLPIPNRLKLPRKTDRGRAHLSLAPGVSGAIAGVDCSKALKPGASVDADAAHSNVTVRVYLLLLLLRLLHLHISTSTFYVYIYMYIQLQPQFHVHSRSRSRSRSRALRRQTESTVGGRIPSLHHSSHSNQLG